MSWFGKSDSDKAEIKKVREMADKNARELKRVESQDLRKIKSRQDDIERRLALLQQEYDVQTAQNRGTRK